MMSYLESNYSPAMQVKVCQSKDNVFFGNSPSLAELNRDYNQSASKAWLVVQLTDLAIFSNCQTLLTDRQQLMLAEMITAEYYYLKVTELMYFFYNLKLGKYGKFYGNLSPLHITSALRTFSEERREILFKHESELTVKQINMREKGITYDEYLKLKENGEL